MSTEEYRKLWQEAIRLCEMEPNKEEAESFGAIIIKIVVIIVLWMTENFF